MSKDNKRRDSKGRILRTGEQQRQDGKFMCRGGEQNSSPGVCLWKSESAQGKGASEYEPLQAVEVEICDNIDYKKSTRQPSVSCNQPYGRR